MLIRNTRRDIARVNTILAERVRAGGEAPAAPAAAASADTSTETAAVKSKRPPTKQTAGTGDLTCPATRFTSAA